MRGGGFFIFLATALQGALTLRGPIQTIFLTQWGTMRGPNLIILPNPSGEIYTYPKLNLNYL